MTYEAQLWAWYWISAALVLGIILVLAALWLVVRVVSSAWHSPRSTP